jgi:hypothetical protein
MFAAEEILNNPGEKTQLLRTTLQGWLVTREQQIQEMQFIQFIVRVMSYTAQIFEEGLSRIKPL